MMQQVKYPILSQQQLGSMLWHRFDPWPRNFQMADGGGQRGGGGGNLAIWDNMVDL